LIIYYILGTNILNAFTHDVILGTMSNRGMIHVLSTLLKNGFNILMRKYTAIALADKIIKLSVKELNKKDERIFLDYRLKPESKTRYWRKVESFYRYIQNKSIIKGILEKTAQNNEDWRIYKLNEFDVDFAICHIIKAMDVCLFIYSFSIFYVY